MLKARAAVRWTTLVTAWWCGVVALVGWLVAWLLPADPLAGHVAYFVAIVTMLPFVAVLGARKPIDRAWPFFVLLPLCLVLSLPSISTLWRGAQFTLRLETPTFIGFVFVLVMGIGNYLFTHFALPALLVGGAILLLVLPATEFLNLDLTTAFHSAAIGLGLAGAIGWRQSRRQVWQCNPHENLWTDFRNHYGLVWTKRVMDRVNWTATEENWPIRLDLFGIVTINKETTPDEHRHAMGRLDTTFRWLLKRFVNEDWIDRRLGPKP